MKILGAFLVCLYSFAASAQKLEVKIIDRHSSDISYSYQAPAQINTTTTAGAYGSTTTTGTVSGGANISYSVTGATFSLLLPDGRIVVVNCKSKYKPKGDYINQRDCRQPVVNDITVDISGKHAKLEWPVSLDGKKMESETYNIIGVLPAATASQTPAQ